MIIKHTKYSPVRIALGIYDDDEWQREWTRLSPKEKDELLSYSKET